VKRLVEMHGGTISAESPGVSKGSVFTVRLPLPSTQTALEKAEPSLAQEHGNAVMPLKVLVVDDNIASAKTTLWLLELIGHHASAAHDGIAALEKAREIKPDVVLLDIGLPGMNGYEVCRELRKDPDFRNTVMIAQTGWGQERDRQQAREAGFNHHLIKPVNMESFSKLMREIQTKAAA
jgi:CheY-like chemotaxis protein